MRRYATIRRGPRAAGVLTFSVVFASLVCSTAAAQSVAESLRQLQSHPLVAAARAELRGAEQRLAAAQNPFSFDGAAGVSTTGVEFDLAVGAEPFAFGARYEVVAAAELALARAELNFLAVLTELEARALLASAELALTRAGARTARAELEAAELALLAARSRVEGGALNPEALREPERAVLAASAALDNAEADQRLSEMSLEQLVDGPVTLQFDAELPPGEPLAVRRAQLIVDEATLELSRRERLLYPVAAVNYRQSLGDASGLTASVSSESLGLGLGFDYRGGDYSGDTAGTRLELRVEASLSSEAFAERDVASEAKRAAEARLQAATESTSETLAELEAALAETGRRYELTVRQAADTLADLEDARNREAAGLTTRLGTLQALAAAERAALALAAAEAERLGLQLELAILYAAPPSRTGGRP